MKQNKIDIVIPLGNGSKSNNDELRLFLRSLEKYATGFDNIWIVTSCPPDWLKEDEQLHILYKEDTFTKNKDANLFEKIKLALETTSKTEIVWSCDDCVVLSSLNLSWLPPIFNDRTINVYERNLNSKWHKRMLATLKEINLVDGNWDAHVPQKWNVKKALEAIQDTPYTEPEGRCINSAVMGRIYESKIPPFAIAQQTIKETAENKDFSKLKFNQVFLGYNDSAFLSGLRDFLFFLFPKKSKWENETIQ